jgi:hypothetical protein
MATAQATSVKMRPDPSRARADHAKKKSKEKTARDLRWIRSAVGAEVERYLSPSFRLGISLYTNPGIWEPGQPSIPDLIRVVSLISRWFMDDEPFLLIHRLDSDKRSLVLESVGSSVFDDGDPVFGWSPLADMAEAGYKLDAVSVEEGKLRLRFAMPPAHSERNIQSEDLSAL